MPKARCQSEKMANDYLVLPTSTTLRRMHFCPLTLWNLVARTIIWDNPRKLWHMPKHYSFGRRRHNCPCQVSVYGNSGRLWSLLWHSQMKMMCLHPGWNNIFQNVWACRTHPVLGAKSQPEPKSPYRGSFMVAHSLERLKPAVASQAVNPSPTCEWKVPPQDLQR